MTNQRPLEESVFRSFARWVAPPAYRAEGKESLFEEFQIFLTVGADRLPTYVQTAARLGVPESTLRRHVSRLRALYREALRAEVRRTVDTETAVDGAMRELLRVLTGQ